MTAHKLNREHILSLEDHVLKTPLELLRRSFRTSQRTIEKDFIALNGLVGELKKLDGAEDGEDRGRRVGLGVERAKGLKRKLVDLLPSPSHPAALRPRLEHISKLDTFSCSTDDGFDEWSEKRLIRYIVDYLVRTNRQEEARTLAKSRGVEDLVDIDLFLELHRIEQSIQAGSCTEALAWCGENRGTLKKMKNTLEFSLRLQEYIELCRSRSTLPALAYLKKHLASTTGGGWAETHGAEIKRALVLLTVDEQSARGVGAYASLYSIKRWKILSSKFTTTFQTLYSLPPSPLLSTSLAAGLSALKLPHCSPPSPPPAFTSQPSTTASLSPLAPTFTPGGSSPFPQPVHPSIYVPRLPAPPSPSAAPSPAIASPLPPNPSCPTCSPYLGGVLAKEVPSSNNVNSVIVCRISGKVMDDDAMAFPNGYVYSYEALQHLASQDPEGKITCPRSGYRCEFGKLRKVFLS